ncbi:MAG: hypothetical protein WD045_01300 [Pirellulaceae bacterium]
MKRSLLPSLLCGLLLQAACFVLGGDHPEGDLLTRQPGWPDGVREVLNSPLRNHGYWVNSNDVLFYQGTPKQLQEMLSALDKSPDAHLSVIIHAGKGVAKSPSAKEPVGPADWSVHVHGDGAVTPKQDQVTFHLYLDGSLDLETLKIPAGIPVASGGEIEKFIQKQSEQGRGAHQEAAP